ncbi:MAG: hypothetical protein IM520_03990 [Microcystis sp. M29BS1]|uniref:hypothetical protein n=2 Tax=unclassified Microcystis TaxID=2643300 RepID=UPI00257CD487|nr:MULTISPECIES: hypothetical protein [unclassified Microcystis]MCA2505927.1 hypothetical protein [Microcystis sp. M62BS1]MCA2509771.1 hypothetical protein [Microcystis sp. M60BS1]MCA2544120.1 hypothetical protein [Microcystis sp. M55BS1]MCA2559564.1 hypothetical protein [Microcystis sp. M43BS1]MCA2586497.1 hypothetical protein [Microcystis sp. M34BS1]MCA2598504.1 hypothetical protein [Microcystis sp. M38BS1]MCA2599295.1 hypothetical protein [Microcystis sp. M29BS1]
MTILSPFMDKQLKGQCFQEKEFREGYIVQIRGFWFNLMSDVPTTFYEKHSQMRLTAMG